MPLMITCGVTYITYIYSMWMGEYPFYSHGISFLLFCNSHRGLFVSTTYWSKVAWRSFTQHPNGFHLLLCILEVNHLSLNTNYITINDVCVFWLNSIQSLLYMWHLKNYVFRRQHNMWQLWLQSELVWSWSCHKTL